jgi:DNA polymerase-3 subunit epsilon
MNAFEAELHALALRCSTEFRILRKLTPREMYPWPIPDGAKIGVIVDVETTGLDPSSDEVIELGMLRFAYSAGGTILGPVAEFQGFREPSQPIPDHISRLTGITDTMVAGQRIDGAAMDAFVESADLVVAHNAGFDRRFCERLSDAFVHRRWACSQTQLPWREEGIEGSKLFYLTTQQGFWHEGHRALDDCYALLELLEMPLPVSHRITIEVLLNAASKPTAKIWALNAPFAIKDRLRQRGYRWNIGDDGRPRAWNREIDPDQVEAEIAYLDSLGFADKLEPLITEVDALTRFSDRLF